MIPELNADLVHRLIAEQFPQWAGLPVRPVRFGGWDNRTFHLGERMSVRLPSAEGYTPQVEKEQRWLPKLAPRLPLPIPAPLALGKPGHGYPWPWSIYGWLDGENAAVGQVNGLEAFATDLGHFLVALQGIEVADGPPAGPHSFYRGAPLTTYDAETRQAIASLSGEIDADATTTVWESALAATWHGPPVWFHGDVAVGNLLVQHGRLSAVIDFGCAGVGDPACDTVMAWTRFSGRSRAAFSSALPLDAATWARGRGWALWKALITLTEYIDTDPLKATDARRVIAEVLNDPAA